jgi:hypothetical protein
MYLPEWCLQPYFPRKVNPPLAGEEAGSVFTDGLSGNCAIFARSFRISATMAVAEKNSFYRVLDHTGIRFN